ncbi:MAG TPA: HAMP domain-containing sensor histidine kinase [Patescibacteria group bacterium]|nr:HAMP domain-containing sensor histidine kinase [Patescibacteria group bacterium]
MTPLGFLRTPTFRLAAIFSAILTAFTIAIFSFIFWQTAMVVTHQVDHGLERDAAILANESPQLMQALVEQRVGEDFHRIIYAGLFDPEMHWLAGNLQQFPSGLSLNGKARRMDLHRLAPHKAILETGRMVARRLPDGRILVIGRNIDSLTDLAQAVARALKVGLIPAIILILFSGAVLGQRIHREIVALHQTAKRIAQGDLWERLPTRGADDNFDRLAATINQILDGIGATLDEVKSTSDNIAHDLRTPLTRVRASLQRARETAFTYDDLRLMVDRAIAGLDQTLRIITALLRLGEISSGKRRATFRSVDLRSVVQEVADFYEPVAEDKGLSFDLRIIDVPPAHGDHDLLVEAVVNLIDNAVKFTPAGGFVRLSLELADGSPLIRVQDNGPGIPPEERALVMRRFYRSNATRHVQGCGLGLNLVEAIAHVHGYRLAIRDGAPGCIVELTCRADSHHVR